MKSVPRFYENEFFLNARSSPVLGKILLHQLCISTVQYFTRKKKLSVKLNYNFVKFRGQKQMPQEVQPRSTSKLFLLFWRHTSVPVLCGNTTLHGRNVHNLDTRPWSGSEGRDLGCHLGPSSKDTWWFLAISPWRHDYLALEFPEMTAARQKVSPQTGNFGGDVWGSLKVLDAHLGMKYFEGMTKPRWLEQQSLKAVAIKWHCQC